MKATLVTYRMPGDNPLDHLNAFLVKKNCAELTVGQVKSLFPKTQLPLPLDKYLVRFGLPVSTRQTIWIDLNNEEIVPQTSSSIVFVQLAKI